MAWTTVASVRERVRQATVANKWQDSDIEARIARAETHLEAILTPRYGSTEVALWDTAETCPAIIEALAADQAAVFVNQDGYGQSPAEPGTPGGDLQAQVNQMLDDLASGKKYLIDADGEVIKPIDTGLSKLASTTQDKEPVFTMGNQVQDTSLKGTLDGF